MLPEHIPNALAMTGGYAPYFYASGLYSSYAVPSRRTSHAALSERSSLYDFTSDLVRKPHPYHPQTVDDVIRRGYLSVPTAEPESAAISDKTHTSWLGLDDIIGQVRERHDIYRKNLNEIELAKCYVISSLLRQAGRARQCAGRRPCGLFLDQAATGTLPGPEGRARAPLAGRVPPQAIIA